MDDNPTSEATSAATVDSTADTATSTATETANSAAPVNTDVDATKPADDVKTTPDTSDTADETTGDTSDEETDSGQPTDTPAPEAKPVVVPKSVINDWLDSTRPNFADAQEYMNWDTVTLATFMNHPVATGQAYSRETATNGDQLPNGDLVIVPKYHVPFGFANLALNFGVGMNVIRYYNGIPNKLASKFDVRPGRKIVIPAGTVYVPEGK